MNLSDVIVFDNDFAVYKKISGIKLSDDGVDIDVFSKFNVDKNVREYVYDFLKNLPKLNIKYKFKDNDIKDKFYDNIEEFKVNIFEIFHIINLCEINLTHSIMNKDLSINDNISSCKFINASSKEITYDYNYNKFKNLQPTLEIEIDENFMVVFYRYINVTISKNKMSISNLDLLDSIVYSNRSDYNEVVHMLQYAHYIILLNTVNNNFIELHLIEMYCKNLIELSRDGMRRSINDYLSGVGFKKLSNNVWNGIHDIKLNLVSIKTIGQKKFEKITNFKMFFLKKIKESDKYETHYQMVKYTEPVLLLLTNHIYNIDMIKLRDYIFNTIKGNVKLYNLLKRKYKNMNIAEFILQIPEIYKGEYIYTVYEAIKKMIYKTHGSTYTGYKPKMVFNMNPLFLNIASTLSLYKHYKFDLYYDIINKIKSNRYQNTKSNRSISSYIKEDMANGNNPNGQFVNNLNLISDKGYYIQKITSKAYTSLMTSVKSIIYKYRTFYNDITSKIYINDNFSGNRQIVNEYEFRLYNLMHIIISYIIFNHGMLKDWNFNQNEINNIVNTLNVNYDRNDSRLRIESKIKTDFPASRWILLHLLELNNINSLVDIFQDIFNKMELLIPENNKKIILKFTKNIDESLMTKIKEIFPTYTNSITYKTISDCNKFSYEILKSIPIYILNDPATLESNYTDILNNISMYNQNMNHKLASIMLDYINCADQSIHIMSSVSVIDSAIDHIKSTYTSFNKDESLLKQLYDINILKPVEIEFTHPSDPDRVYKLKIIRPLSILNLIPGKINNTSCCQFIGGYAKDIVKESYINKNITNGLLMVRDKNESKYKVELLSLIMYDESNETLCLDSVEYGDRKLNSTLGENIYSIIRMAYMSYMDYLNYPLDEIYIGTRYGSTEVTRHCTDLDKYVNKKYKDTHGNNKSYIYTNSYEHQGSTAPVTNHIFKPITPDTSDLDDEFCKIYNNLKHNGSISTIYSDSRDGRNKCIYNLKFHKKYLYKSKFEEINKLNYKVVSKDEDYIYTNYYDIAFKF